MGGFSLIIGRKPKGFRSKSEEELAIISARIPSEVLNL